MKRALACILAVLLLLLPLVACQNEETPSTPVSTAESTPASEAEASSTVEVTGTPEDAAWPADVPMPLEELTWGMSPEDVETALAEYIKAGASARYADGTVEALTGLEGVSAEFYSLPTLAEGDFAMEFSYIQPIGYNGDEPGTRLDGVSLRLATDDIMLTDTL